MSLPPAASPAEHTEAYSPTVLQLSKLPTATVDIEPQQSSPSPKRVATCPFASLAASSAAAREQTVAIVPSSTNSTTTVNVRHRQCPRWVRVLRFSARFIAKQVVLRSMKKVVGQAFRSMCPALQAAPKQL
ncbi:hypothetical protein FGB62_64g026 [Gracilaria domingensis]|nr:hypothetical protein FGB62_64g026 [Gracilaria domingensis]